MFTHFVVFALIDNDSTSTQVAKKPSAEDVFMILNNAFLKVRGELKISALMGGVYVPQHFPLSLVTQLHSILCHTFITAYITHHRATECTVPPRRRFPLQASLTPITTSFFVYTFLFVLLLF